MSPPITQGRRARRRRRRYAGEYTITVGGHSIAVPGNATAREIADAINATGDSPWHARVTPAGGLTFDVPPTAPAIILTTSRR